MQQDYYHETRRYRCLVEHLIYSFDELQLMMCGVEYCAVDKAIGPFVRDGYHLHVVLSGKGYLEVKGQKSEVHQGQMFIEKPGEMTFYYPDRENPWTYCWMTFSGNRAEELAHEAGFVEGKNVCKCNLDVNEFYKIVDQVLMHQDLSISGNLYRQGLLSQFLGLAVDSAKRGLDARNRKNSLASQKDVYMKYVTKYVQGNYATITVEDIAGYLGISRSYLTRLFQEHLGMSPNAYLMQVRMDKSAQLLGDTQLPVREIADMIGYEDQMTFSKAFKRHFGMSPKYYRETLNVKRDGEEKK